MHTRGDDPDTDRRLAQVERLQLLGRLAGGLAHDFNNVLTIILGYADLIGSDVDPDGPVAHALSEMRRAAHRGAGLTRQLLTLGRRAPVRHEPLDIALLVHDSARLLRRLLPEHVGLQISAAGSAEGRGDASQLEQLVANLVLNAREAIVARGEVKVAVELAGGKIRLTVADNGRGMDPLTLARAFDPFFTTKPDTRSTGLGLPIAQSIVEAHGGAIRMQSTVGSGTLVEVLLPAGSGAGSGREATDDAAPAFTGSILLVDEQRATRHVRRATLADAGLFTVAVANVDEALKASRACRGQIDLLLLGEIPPADALLLTSTLQGERPALQALRTAGTLDGPALVEEVRRTLNGRTAAA